MSTRTGKSIAVTLSVLTLVAVFLSDGIPPIPLDVLDRRLESMAGRLLDRKVKIAGPVWVKLSPRPVLDFAGITVSDPQGWPEDGKLLAIRSGQAKVRLLSLLWSEVHIDNLAVDGVDLRLVTRGDQATNYDFPTLEYGTEEDSGYELRGLDLIRLRDIRFSYLDEISGKNYVVTVDQAEGNGTPASPLRLSLNGTAMGQAYSLEVTGGSLRELLVPEKESWPLADGRLKLPGMTLDLSGALVRAKDEIGGHLYLSLAGQNLDDISAITGVSMPKTGDYSLEARIGVLPGRLHFTELQLTALNSSLEGDLVCFLDGERPRLAGDLTLPIIHPALFSALKGRPTGYSTANVGQDNAGGALPWEIMQLLDADLHLRVGNLAWDRVPVSDLQATVSLVDGDLRVPFSFTVMAASAGGRLDMLTGDETPVMELTLTSESTELAPLLAALAGPKQLTGQLGALALNAKTRGHGMQDLTRSLDLKMQIGATELSSESGPILKTNALSLERRPGQAFALSGAGDFLGRPFDLRGRAGGVPLNLRLKACDTDLQFDAALPTEQRPALTTFRFSVSGEKLCGFMAPAEAFLGESVDFSVSGEGELSSAGWAVDLETVKLGEMVLDARLEQRMKNKKHQPIVANIHSKSLDLSPLLQDRLKTSRRTPSPTQDETEAGKADDAKEPISPQQQAAEIAELLATEIAPLKRFLATDVILKLHVQKLNTGQCNATGVRLSAETQDGKLTQAPFQATVGGERFIGNADMDFTGEVPIIHVELASEDVSLPDLFRGLQLGDAPTISADHIGLQLTLKGKNIKDLLRQSSQQMTIKGGKWMVPRELSEPLRIDIDQAEYRTSPDTPAVISLSGFVNTRPLSLEVTEDGLLGRKSNKPLIMTLQAILADTELRIDSQVIRRAGADNVLRLNTLLFGKRMSELNEVLGISLPPLGPYRIAGSLQIERGAYTLHDMVLQVGDSVLKGEMVVAGTLNDKGSYGIPITFRTKLNAESIQLNDFRVGDWSALGVQEEEALAKEVDQSQDAQQASEEQLNDLLGPRLATAFKGSLDIEVQQVLSGKDHLGGGLLSARLKNGRYTLDTLRLDIPGGTIQIQGAFRPEEASTEAGLSMQIEHFDYGILVRRAVPKADVKGELNLNLDLYSEAENPHQLKQSVNGRFRLGVVPQELLAGIIDLWAINIITAALPKLMKGTESTVNCLAGDFILDDGIMRPEVFLLDTTKMRVEGKGEVNFKTNTINFHLKPAPKKAQFFSLATPVSVSGTITDADIGVTPGAVLGTIARLATSVVAVPFKKIFTDDMKPDGREVCGAAISWVKEARTR